MIISKKYWHRLEWGVVVMFVLAGMLGAVRVLLAQEVVWVSSGLGWDGVHYNRLLEFFRNGEFREQSASFPFCGRIGTPAILSILPDKVGFYEFNLLFGTLFAATMIYLASQYTNKNSYAIGAAVFIGLFLHFAPLKFTNYYPVYTDPPFMFLTAMAAVFIAKRYFLLAACFCLLAIPFREAAFYIIPLIGCLAVLRSEQKFRSALLFGAVLLAGAGLKIAVLAVTGCEPASQLITAFKWFYRFLTDPFRFLAVCAGISMTIGPLFILIKASNLWERLSDEKYQFAFIALIYFGALSIVGGSDITRIFYSFAPLYAPLLFLAFSQASLSGATSAFFGWLMTNQILGEYKQPAADWPNYDIVGAWSQTPDHGHPVIAVVVLTTWWVLYLIKNTAEPIEKKLRKISEP